jgi:hypothetical protein
MTRLTADEITTFAEVFGHELTLAQMTHLEEWVDAHRAEAIVMWQLVGEFHCEICNSDTHDALGHGDYR